MRKYLLAAASVCLLASPSFAQTAVSNAAGTGIANSRSDAAAVAISGQGGGGGAGGAGGNATGGAGGNAAARGGNSISALTINNPANTTSTSNVNSTVSGSTTQHVVSSGTTSVKTNPAVFAPGLSAAGLETCLGSASGGVSVVGFGLTGGSSYPDEGCQARLDSRTLWSMGLKAAALARLCQRDQIYRSMPDVCARYAPVVTPVGYPAPVVRAYASTDQGETIMLIDGKTGKERPCSIYAQARQKCLAWADAPPKIKIAAVTPQPRKRPATVASPKPEATVAVAPTPDNKN